MPRKREQEVFTFKELSPKAQKKALEHYRQVLWDSSDADAISDMFKSVLSERGFSDPEVGWGLNYSQGDGVCFWGSIDLYDFFKWALHGDDPEYKKRMRGKVRQFLPLSFVVGVRVRHEGRECHWNSMQVEVELTGSEIDLVPKALRDQVQDLLDDRRAPRWVGPKEWRPSAGPRRPHVEAALIKAREKWKEIETKTANEFGTFMEQWVKDTSKELEKMGYAEIEYRTSDEYIEEFFAGNEFEFDVDGDKVK